MLRFSLHARDARGRIAGASEHPFEGDARIDLHRQRRRLAGPRDRVHVGAAVAGDAAADVAGEVLGGELERRERRVLSDVPGEHLIDRHAEADVLRLGLLGDDAAQPAGGAHRVVGRVLATGARQVAVDGQVIAERLERLQDRRDLERAVRRRRHPVLDRHRRSARRRRRTAAAMAALCADGRERRQHRVEERQREGGAEAAQDGSTRQRTLRHEHDDPQSPCPVELRLQSRRTPPGRGGPEASAFWPHLERRALHDAEHDRREAIVLRRGVARRCRGPPADRTPEALVRAHKSASFPRASGRRPPGASESAARSSATPCNGVPSGSAPLASTGAPASRVRQAPTALKFSIENPSGSVSR